MLALRNIQMTRGGRTVLDIDRLDIPTDRLTVVLGHNGSGKSTLASLLAGLEKPERGSIRLAGDELSELGEKARARRIAFLPQKLPASAGLTCRELVRLGRFPWRGLFGRWREEDESAVEAALRATGTHRFAGAYADELSGGERQRVWIAMLLAQAAPVMILDEPTSALDLRHQYGVLSLLAGLNRESGRGVIVILHDINLALRFAGHVIALKGGRVLFEGGVERLHDEANLRALLGTNVRLADHPFPPADAPAPARIAVVCE